MAAVSFSPQRVALVTGSSRGLGRDIALRLGSDGFAVAVNSRDDHEAARDVVRQITQRGGTAHEFAADVTDEDQVSEMLRVLRQRLGEVDTLVLNATGPQPEKQLPDVGWPDHLDQLVYFVKSPVILLGGVLNAMRDRNFGRIINIDSEVAHRPPPGRSAYAIAKSAQIGLTLAWARELARYGITVNTVAPGFIPVERHHGVPAAELDAYLATLPAGRLGAPTDIAHAVAFFASTDAGFITGQRIVVDGGRALQ